MVKKSARSVIQQHHLIYENKDHHQEEVIDKIYKGEHWICTQLQRRKKVSCGFIKQLKMFILLHEDQSINLMEVKP